MPAAVIAHFQTQLYGKATVILRYDLFIAMLIPTKREGTTSGKSLSPTTPNVMAQHLNYMKVRITPAYPLLYKMVILSQK